MAGGCANNTGSAGNLGLARGLIKALADRMQESSDLDRHSPRLGGTLNAGGRSRKLTGSLTRG